MSKEVGILIRTYDKDAVRLSYAVRSIKRFLKDYSSITVVCPRRSADTVRHALVEFQNDVNLKICQDFDNDYIGQQITKLNAPDFVSEDYVMHFDADCIFTSEVSVEHYFEAGLPLSFYRTYESLRDDGVELPWSVPTSKFLSRQIHCEFMCAFPFVYPRELYSDLNEYFIDLNGFGYDKIAANLRSVNEFSEFNLIGAFSYMFGDKYNMHRSFNRSRFDFKVRQFCAGDAFEMRDVDHREAAVLEDMLA